MPDFADPQSLIDLRNLLLAIVVGFLIGFEREWTKVTEAKSHKFAGARTFTLIAFIGGLAGLIGGLALLVAAFLAVAALTLAAYWAGARKSPGAGGTTEMAILATFLLGAAATHGETLLAAVGGVGVAIILSVKETIERAAASLSQKELRAALRFLAISIIILPVLPNEGYGPYAALIPREIWLMVVFISGLSFTGYWLMKFLGAKHGVLLTGLVGGLASSTATTLSLAEFAREKTARPKAVAAGIVGANVVMLIRVGFLLAAVSRDVLREIAPALALGVLVGGVVALVLWRASEKSDLGGEDVNVENPMEIRPALIFAALLAIIAVASRFGADQFGDSALYVVGFISGLADVDAMSLTAGRQAAAGSIFASVAAGAVIAAVASNIAVKGVMAATIGGAGVGRLVGVVFAAIMLAGAGGWVFL